MPDPSKKVRVGVDLYYEQDVFSFSAMSSKEDVTLYLSQGVWEDGDDLRSQHFLEVEGAVSSVRLPLESARQLYHALGCVLEED